MATIEDGLYTRIDEEITATEDGLQNS